ncbi:MAG TPA: hypothetical protein VMU95_41270 [Trebonia sp.]|nr:hypothetical protein [Trebonia sp.]
MASTETPATTAVIRVAAGQVIFACKSHVLRTVAEFRKLGDEKLSIVPADPTIHGCKGCLDDWPALW